MCDRVVDHAVFGALHGVDLTCLLGYGHILVDYAYAAFAGYGDGQTGLGDGVHGGRHGEAR